MKSDPSQLGGAVLLPWEMGWDDAEDAQGREECLRYVTKRCQEALIELRDNP